MRSIHNGGASANEKIFRFCWYVVELDLVGVEMMRYRQKIEGRSRKGKVIM